MKTRVASPLAARRSPLAARRSPLLPLCALGALGLIQLALVPIGSANSAATPAAMMPPLDSTYALVEELPVFNPPGTDAWGEADAIGIRTECCSSGESLSRAFTTMSHGESGASRVLLHTGQAVVTVTDMAIAGRESAVPFELTRRHTTRRDEAHSIFGPAWSCNLEHWAVEVPSSNDIVFHGFGRSDRYTFDSGQSTMTVIWWNGGRGRLDRAKLDTTTTPDTLTLYRRGGVKMIYEAELVSGEIQARLTWIVAPTPSNAILINYSSGMGPLIERKITTVVDSFGRTITFNYTGDLVTSVVDFDGRTALYAYDGDDALVSVTSPEVNSTGGLADFTSGKTTTYEYVKHGTIAELFNALEAIRTPRQGAMGASTLAWTFYDDTMADAANLGWVESHTVGNPGAGGDLAAGGTFEYAYAAHGSAVSMSPFGGVNTETIVTSVTDPRGVESEVTLNRFGQVLEETITEVGAGLRPGSTGPWTNTFTYTDDGLMLTCELPLLNSCALTYPSTPTSRFAAGNVEAVEWSPDGTRPTLMTQATLRTEYVHEPVFQKVFESVAVRGFEGMNDPADYTTVQLYSYMEDLDAANTAFRERLDMSEMELATLFTTLGIDSLGDTDINGDSVTDQICGLLIKVIHPDATIPTQTAGTIGSTTQSAEEFFVHNGYGQLLSHKDAEQNLHEYEYFGADDPDGDGTADTGSMDTSTGGYLKEIARDTTAESGRNSTVNSTPVNAITSFEYETQSAGGGSLPGNKRGIPTKITDPRGVVQMRLVNELDQVVSTFAAAAVPGMSGLTAFAYRTNYLHDADDNLVEVQVQRTDLVDTMVDEFVSTVYTHDILGMVVREVEDEGGMGHFGYTTEHDYDESGNRLETVRAVGLAEEATEQWTYDERHLGITHTRGVGEAEEATTSTEIDENGNVTVAIDAHAADETVYAYDGYDRVIEVTDRVGTVTSYVHDASGNVEQTEVVGAIDILMPTPATLAHTWAYFDERDRRYRTDTELFHLAGFDFGAIDPGTLDDGETEERVVSLTVLDRLGRTIKSIDADTDEFVTKYNGMGWVIETIDPLANEVDTTYDDNGNVLERVDSENSTATSSADVFDFAYEYDALNRRTKSIQPNEEFTTTEYDSLGSVIRTTDELGNQSEFVHDRLGRQIQSDVYLAATSSGTSAGGATSMSNDSSQGGGDGAITTHTVWDALSRRTAVYDDNDGFGMMGATPVTFAYDTLGRRTGVTYGDTTTATWTYNEDSELVSHVTQQDVTLEYTTDAEGRVNEIDVVAPMSPPPTLVGTARQQFAWDGLGRLWGSSNENFAGTSVGAAIVVHWLDSLGRVILEAQSINSGRGPDVIETGIEYQGANRLVRTTYPDGAEVERVHDALDRDIVIDDPATTFSAQSNDVETDYVGRHRIAYRSYDNDTFLDRRNSAGSTTTTGTTPGYDDNARDVLIQWNVTGPNLVAGWEYTYDLANMVQTETRQHLLDAMSNPFVDTHTRDSAHRSVEFERDSGAVTTSERLFDGAGKMVEFGDEAAAVSVSVDDSMSQYVDLDPMGSPMKPRVYDDLGNLIDDEGTLLYFYDAFGRLVQVWDEVGPTLQAIYLYDALDRRVLTVAGGDYLQFAYAGNGDVIEERLYTSGVPWRQYMRDGMDGKVLRMRTTTFTSSFTATSPLPASLVQNDEYHFYHHNSRGDVGGITGSRGGVVEYQTYSWLGRMDVLDQLGDPVVPNLSTIGSPWGFQGMRFNPESGWVCGGGGSRHYDSDVGETVNPGGSNGKLVPPSKPRTTTGTEEEKKVCLCGPDITEWLWQEVSNYRNWFLAVLGEDAGTAEFNHPAELLSSDAGFSGMIMAKLAGNKNPDKWWIPPGLDSLNYKGRTKFGPTASNEGDCPSPECPNTVTVLGVCWHTSEIGNLMFGLAMQQTGFGLLLTLEAQDRFAGGSDPTAELGKKSDSVQSTRAVHLGHMVGSILSGSNRWSSAGVMSLVEQSGGGSYEHCNACTSAVASDAPGSQFSDTNWFGRRRNIFPLPPKSVK